MTLRPMDNRGILSPMPGQLSQPGILSSFDPDTGLALPNLTDSLQEAPNLPYEDHSGGLGPVETPSLKGMGFWDKIRNTPGATSGLMALGAGLLSGTSFQDGLAKGGMGYMKAIDDAKERNRPQVKFLANGAVQAITDPQTGETRYVTTPAQNALKEILGTKLDGQMKLQENKNDAAWKRAVATFENREKLTGMKIDSSEKIAGMNIDSREDIATGRNRTALEIARMGQDGKDKDREARVQLGSTKPAPAAAMAKYQDLYSAKNTYEQVQTNGAQIIDMIEDGSLPLSGPGNAYQEAALAGYMPKTKATTNYAMYKQFKEGLRNAYLLASKGMQTDGDADRAMREIESGSGDPESVKANLNVVMNFINRRREVAQDSMEMYENEYGIGESKPSSGPSSSRHKSPASGSVSGVTWKLKK